MSQQLTTQAKDKITNIMGMLEARKGQFKELLPRYLTPEKLFRVAQTAIAKSPQLLDCTPASLVIALMDAAQTGLEVNGRDAALVPYGKQCQFQPMYHGLVKQAVTEGVAKKIQARLVYENDDFDLWFDPEPHIKHIPAYTDEGEVVGAYAYAVMPDGEIVIEFMNKRKLDHIKNKAKSRSGPWSTDEEEMYRKTPIKRLFKTLPIPDRLEYAIAVDNWNEAGGPRVDMPLLDIPPVELQEPKQTATEKLAEATRKPRSDKGTRRGYADVEVKASIVTPPEADEGTNAGEARVILPTDDTKPTGPGYLVDSEGVQDMESYCAQLNLIPDTVAKRFGADKLSLLTKEEAGQATGWLLDQMK
jgi:recombination protein RecT